MQPPNPFLQQRPLEGVRHVIAVGAGKGGVGKSTVAVNLAVSLSQLGRKVGLLDADIYGPSVPRMMGVADLKPNVGADRKLQPVTSYGLKTMSIGFMVDSQSAIIWRGPMLFKAMEQFLREVTWGELDELIIDLPPGTGDVQLTLVQKVPVTGAIVVCTPQDTALLDVRRCVDMFDKVKVPVIGVIENMASYVCPHCHHESSLFMAGDLHHYCDAKKIEMLGQIPFNLRIGEGAEKGSPFALHADTIEQNLFRDIAKTLASKLDQS